MTRLTSPETELRMERGNYIAFFKKCWARSVRSFCSLVTSFAPMHKSVSPYMIRYGLLIAAS